MTAIFLAVLPVFAVIALGYGAARRRLISPEGARGIDAYVFWFAIPALLFRTMLELDLDGVAPWRLLACYYAGALVIWGCAGALAATWLRGQAQAGGAALATAASFGNILLMGLPIALLSFGPEAVAPAAFIVAVHAPLHWLFASLWAEWAQRQGRVRLGRLLGQVALSLARNPLLIALAVGFLWRLAGLDLPELPARIIGLLADSSVAAALFALGLSLASYSIRADARVLAAILILKLTVFPIIMWILAVHVFALPPLEARVAILFAALPVGVNAYLFAARYSANVAAASSAIMLSVPVSAVTLSAVLFLIGG